MKKWRRMVMLAVGQKKPHEPLSRAQLSITRHFYRTLDFDGLVGSFKPVVDGLIHAGVIVDDNWRVLGAWQCDQQFRPKKEGPRLEVTIKGVS